MDQEKNLKVFKMRSDNFNELNEKIKEYSVHKIDSVTILRVEDTSYFLTIHYYDKNMPIQISSTPKIFENKNIPIFGEHYYTDTFYF
jgi:hypothetical protein